MQHALLIVSGCKEIKEFAHGIIVDQLRYNLAFIIGE